ncbi:hypothetical protein BU14_3152s0001, partial [Porphyra umbilicalis]
MLLAPFASVNGVTLGYAQMDVKYHRDIFGHGGLPRNHAYRFVFDETTGQILFGATNPDGTKFMCWLRTRERRPTGGGRPTRRRSRSMVVLSAPPAPGALPEFMLHRTDIEEDIVDADPTRAPPLAPTAAAAAERGAAGPIAAAAEAVVWPQPLSRSRPQPPAEWAPAAVSTSSFASLNDEVLTFLDGSLAGGSAGGVSTVFPAADLPPSVFTLPELLPTPPPSPSLSQILS